MALRTKNNALYDTDFYLRRHTKVYSYALKILSNLFEVVPVPMRTLDFGSATGAWSEAGKTLGVATATCVDGPWVPEDLKSSSINRFITHNLEVNFQAESFGLNYDREALAMCIEVLEHLSPSAGEALISVMCSLVDVVIFSAAYPGQGGVGHVNEQHVDHWANIFKRHKFNSYDVIRPRIWDDGKMPIFYRQNMVIFVRSNSHFEPLFAKYESPVRALIHPEVYNKLLKNRHRTIFSFLSRK